MGLLLPEPGGESCLWSPILQIEKLRLRQGKDLLVRVTAGLASSSARKVLKKVLLHSGDIVRSGFSPVPPTAWPARPWVSHLLSQSLSFLFPALRRGGRAGQLSAQRR